MDEEVLESMVQDGDPEQEMMVVMQFELPPQINPEPEMGAAVAAEYDTSPSLLRNPPPIPAGTAHPSTPDMAQLFAMLVEMRNGINNKMDEMSKNMDANMQAFRSDMRALRGETRQVGQCLQAGIMAPPRAGTNELKGSAPAGADQIIWGTCWERVVTEKVTDGDTRGKTNRGDGDVHE